MVERELARGFYSPATYMAVKLVLDGLLLRVLSASIYGSLFYWIVGLRASASAFALFLGVLATFSALVSDWGLRNHIQCPGEWRLRNNIQSPLSGGSETTPPHPSPFRSERWSSL